MEQRELYRNDVNAVWDAIKDLRRHTDDVLRNEPLLPHGALVCSTRKGSPTACTNFASPHTNPHTGLVIDDLCDACWWQLCPRCYLRPTAEYRPTCDACRKRDERGKEAA
jgi:transposase